MNEFEIISRYFKCPVKNKNTLIGVGDDSALFQVEKNQCIAVSTDAMVVNTHFFPWSSPESIAHKLVTCNVSDLAACGAKPAWATLALSLNEVDEVWINSFSKRLLNQLDKYNIDLIGGDTCKGNLQITLTFFGVVNKHDFIKRSGAEVNDLLYTSGTLGDCKVALELERITNNQHSLSVGEHAKFNDIFKNIPNHNQFYSKFHYPEPQLDLALSLTNYATSMIDISDGLLQDVLHLLNSSLSNLGVNIITSRLKHSKCFLSNEVLMRYIKRINHFNFDNLFFDYNSAIALTSGEEYELCFTIKACDKVKVESIASSKGYSVSHIGFITDKNMVEVNNQKLTTSMIANLKGYKHF